MEIDKILNICSKAERDSLRLLESAVAITADAYKAGYSADKMVDYEAATKAFDSKIESLQKKYAAELDESVSINISWDDFEETKNRSAVWRFLQSLGYMTPQRTFQRHCKTGEIKKSEAGLFTKKLTRDYIKSQGLLSEKEDISEPTMEAVKNKAAHEEEKMKYQAANERLKYQKAKKLVGSRPEFNLGMASRLVVMDNYLRGFGEQYAAELIALSNGNQDKRDDFAAFWLEKFDETMRALAKPLDFKVIFKNES